jgi:hypothetical protein
MTRSIAAALTAAAAALTMAQAAAAHPHKPPVPSDIAVPDGNKAYLDAHAVGVQIYSCNATTTGGFAYTLVAPRANLYDGRKLIATHFAGPTWQAKDGSKAVGTRVNGVNVDPTAIDWLLLSTVSTPGPGKHADTLADTTFIQRINTTGGRAPAAANCNASTVGTQVEIPYTADYVFFKARRGHCVHGHRS